MWLLIAVSILCCIISICFILLSILVWGFKPQLIFCVLGCCWPDSFVGYPRSILLGWFIVGSQCTLCLDVCYWFGIVVDSKFGCVPLVISCSCFGFVLSIFYWQIIRWSAIAFMLVVLSPYLNWCSTSRVIEDILALLKGWVSAQHYMSAGEFLLRIYQP